jgi:hypothetical protein
MYVGGRLAPARIWHRHFADVAHRGDGVGGSTVKPVFAALPLTDRYHAGRSQCRSLATIATVVSPTVSNRVSAVTPASTNDGAHPWPTQGTADRALAAWS